MRSACHISSGKRPGALWPCVASASVRTSEHAVSREVFPFRDEDRGAVVLGGTEVSHDARDAD